MKNYILIALCVLLASCQLNELGEAGKTVRELNTDLYHITVMDDAGFERYLEQGGASSTDEMGEYISDYLSCGPWGKLKCAPRVSGFACSALAAKNALGEAVTGRNYDWAPCKTLIIRCLPEHGYASVATANIDFLGFGDDYDPTDGIINQYKATAAVYVPMDGINEKGLVVADLMAGDDESTNQTDASKPNITTTSAIRLLLNHAADVDEALQLLEQYNMHSDIGRAHHLFVSDAKGQAVCVEWVNNKMIVTESRVLNNHYLCEEKKGIGSGELSLKHEATLLKAYSEHNGILSGEQMADAMFAAIAIPEECDYGGTQWTIVYNQQQGSATYYWRRDRAKSYTFFAGSEVEVIKGNAS